MDKFSYISDNDNKHWITLSDVVNKLSARSQDWDNNTIITLKVNETYLSCSHVEKHDDAIYMEFGGEPITKHMTQLVDVLGSISKSSSPELWSNFPIRAKIKGELFGDMMMFQDLHKRKIDTIEIENGHMKLGAH